MKNKQSFVFSRPISVRGNRRTFMGPKWSTCVSVMRDGPATTSGGVMLIQCWLDMMWAGDDVLQPSQCPLQVQVVSSHSSPPLLCLQTENRNAAPSQLPQSWSNHSSLFFFFLSFFVFVFSLFFHLSEDVKQQKWCTIATSWYGVVVQQEDTKT